MQAQEAQARQQKEEAERRQRAEEERRKREAERAEAERRAAQMREEAKQRWQAFSKQTGAARVVPAATLFVNPFLFKGDAIAVRVSFEEMTAEDTGLFAGESGGGGPHVFVVSGIPREVAARFTSRFYVLLAGRILGKTEARLPLLGTVSVPQLKFVGVHFCDDKKCSNINPGDS